MWRNSNVGRTLQRQLQLTQTDCLRCIKNATTTTVFNLAILYTEISFIWRGKLMLHTASVLMTSTLFTLQQDASVADAMKLSKEHNIRHIPIISSENKLLGMVSQKNLFNKALHMLNLYGTQDSVKIEQETSIKEVMDTECLSILQSTPVTEIIPMFKDNRHGCLPVVDEAMHLKGLITSANFVDFSEKLLSEDN